MTKKTSLTLSVLLLACLASCQVPLAFQEPMGSSQASAWQTPGGFRNAPAGAAQAQQPMTDPAVGRNGAPAQAWAQPQGAQLYDWGGGVVDAPRQGEILTVSGAGPHGLQESVEGRMHIIELYQSVLDERDQLLTEVEALQAALLKTQESLEAQRGVGLTQGTQLQALEEAKRLLLEENRELAGRLTTAQIRRLEAEKLLLETQIAWHKSRGAGPEVRQVANPEKPE